MVDTDPGNVATPVLFSPPTSIATQAHEIWCAVSGGVNWGGCYVWLSVDNVTYSQTGKIVSPSRYGTLTASLAAGSDPDVTNTLAVDLTPSLGTLGAATHAEADSGATLCLIDGELLSYSDLALTAANKYNLTYLRRGLRSTARASHANGAQFVRLDDAIFKFAYDTAITGSTVYVKFQSFNTYGRAVQNLAGVTAYTVGLTVNAAAPAMPTGLAVAGGGSTWAGATLTVICNVADRAASYRFDFYKVDGTTLVRSITSTAPTVDYTASQAAIDGPLREYKIAVTAINTAGSSATTSQLDLTNAAPAAVTSPAIAGGATVATGSCTASGDADLGGYVLYYSTTAGFDPNTAGSQVTSATNSLPVYGLPAATYYGKVAAFDPWTLKPSLLNLSTEISFTITTGGGSTATGGGGLGAGWGGRGGTPLP